MDARKTEAIIPGVDVISPKVSHKWQNFPLNKQNLAFKILHHWIRKETTKPI